MSPFFITLVLVLVLVVPTPVLLVFLLLVSFLTYSSQLLLRVR